MYSEPLTFTVNLRETTTHVSRPVPLLRGDKNAQTVTVTMLDGDTAADLTGYTGSVLVVRSDGATVQMTATLTDNVLTCDLKPACYVYQGRAEIYVRLMYANATSDLAFTRTVVWISAVVDNADTDTIADSTQTLPTIDEFNSILELCEADKAICEQAATDCAAYPVETVKGYSESAAASAQAAAASAASLDMPSVPSTAGNWYLFGNYKTQTMSWQRHGLEELFSSDEGAVLSGGTFTLSSPASDYKFLVIELGGSASVYTAVFMVAVGAARFTTEVTSSNATYADREYHVMGGLTWSSDYLTLETSVTSTLYINIDNGVKESTASMRVHRIYGLN